MDQDQPMFDVPVRLWTVGDPVIVQTIWGDEAGTVTKVATGPLVAVGLERGDVIYISPTRLVARDV